MVWATQIAGGRWRRNRLDVVAADLDAGEVELGDLEVEVAQDAPRRAAHVEQPLPRAERAPAAVGDLGQQARVAVPEEPVDEVVVEVALAVVRAGDRERVAQGEREQRLGVLRARGGGLVARRQRVDRGAHERELLVAAAGGAELLGHGRARRLRRAPDVVPQQRRQLPDQGADVDGLRGRRRALERGADPRRIGSGADRREPAGHRAGQHRLGERERRRLDVRVGRRQREHVGGRVAVEAEPLGLRLQPEQHRRVGGQQDHERDVVRAGVRVPPRAQELGARPQLRRPRDHHAPAYALQHAAETTASG